MKYRKDEQLNQIFNKYIENQKQPSDSVIYEAKASLSNIEGYLSTTKNSTSPCLNSETKKPKFTFSFFLKVFSPLSLMAITILSVTLALPNLDNIMNFSSHDAQFRREDLRENKCQYKTQLEFVPFVEKENVVDYREFYVPEEFNDASIKKDVPVLYYLGFVSDIIPSVELFVENGVCEFPDLGEFKEFESTLSLKNITFFLNSTSKESLIFFKHHSYHYNLKISLESGGSINNFLEHIDGSF